MESVDVSNRIINQRLPLADFKRTFSVDKETIKNHMFQIRSCFTVWLLLFLVFEEFKVLVQEVIVLSGCSESGTGSCDHFR